MGMGESKDIIDNHFREKARLQNLRDIEQEKQKKLHPPKTLYLLDLDYKKTVKS